METAPIVFIFENYVGLVRWGVYIALFLEPVPVAPFWISSKSRLLSRGARGREKSADLRERLLFEMSSRLPPSLLVVFRTGEWGFCQFFRVLFFGGALLSPLMQDTPFHIFWRG